MNPYRKHLINQPNSRLADMLLHPDDYHPDAIAAAREELTTRQLSDDELQQAAQTAHELKTAEEALSKSIGQATHQVAAAGRGLLNWLDASKKTASSDILDDFSQQKDRESEQDDVRLKQIAQAFCIYALVYIILNISMFTLAFRYILSGQSLTWAGLQLIMTVMLVIGCYFFWHRQTSGWVMLAIVITFFVINDGFNLFFNLQYLLLNAEMIVGSELRIAFYAAISLLFLIGDCVLLWLLYRRIVVHKYAISADHKWLAHVAGIAFYLSTGITTWLR
jgi:cation transport ATPase